MISEHRAALLCAARYPIVIRQTDFRQFAGLVRLIESKDVFNRQIMQKQHLCCVLLLLR